MLYKIKQLISDSLSKLFRSDNFIIFIGFLAIFPFLLISFYNNPSADDFCYNYKSNTLGFWNTQLYVYNNWNGRYFSTAVLSIKSLVSEPFFVYRLIPVILLGSLFFSIYQLSSLIFVNLKRRDFYILTFYCFIIYLIQMPSVSQGFYWLAGAVNYQISNILTIGFVYFLIKLLNTNKRIYLLLSIFFAILIIGSNETSMLLFDFLIGIIFIYKYLHHKKINYSLFIILLFAIIFSLIVIKSPGNTLRASNFQDEHELFSAVFNTVIAAINHLMKWIPIIIISIFIFYDYFNTKINAYKPTIFNINPIFAFFVVFSIPFIGFFPGYWIMGNSPPLRTINVIYFYFLIGFIYLSFVLFFKLKKHNKNFISFSIWVKYFLMVIILISMINKNNIRTAYSNLLSGSAYRYNLELINRYELIRNNNKDTCYVPKLISKPATIYFDDITNDSNNWNNECYAKYWNSKPILIKEN